MKKLLVALSVLVITSLTGCKGQAPPDHENTENYKLPNISRIASQWSSSGYNYLLDKNTGVVYLEYDGGHGRAITVMFNTDGTVMTEKDIKREQ